LAAKHYRLHNPDSYLILTGHGLMPSPATVELCDFVYWDTKIDRREIGVGHPKLVNVGIKHAMEKGYKWLFKCRADGVILRSGILTYCHQLLENKQILLTQQTEFARPRAGDLFMYGPIDFLQQCWDITTWYPTDTGLTSFAKNIMLTTGETDWVRCLLGHAAFVDIYNIKWIDLYYNWNTLHQRSADILKNQLDDFEKYLWGTKEGAHTFDATGDMTAYIGPIICEKDWRKRLNENHSTSRKLDGSKS